MAKYCLGDIAPIEQGVVPVSGQYWLLNLDVVESNTGKVLEYVYVDCSQIGASTISFDQSNVLYSKLRPYLNKVVLPDRAGYATSEMLPLKPNEVIITREYLTYFLRSPHFVEFINGKTSGAKMPRANIADLKAVKVECPSIKAQSIIVTQLDTIKSIIEKRQQQLSSLDTLVKARFVEMFGDLKSNPKGWEFKPLSAVCDVRDGTHDSPKYVDSGYPLLTSKNFTDGFVDFSDANMISGEDFDAINQRSKVDFGDIVMPMIGTIGHPVIIDTDRPFAIKNVALIKFGSSSASNVFVREILDSDYFRSIVEEKNRGNTQKFIALGDIRKLQIPIVDIDVQKQFADFVEYVSKLKSVIQQGLDKLETLKSALMQEYFG